MTGIDAVTYDPPIWAMFERKKFWEAHRVMLTREYYHLENLTNLDQLPGHGFKLSLVPYQVGQHHRRAGSSGRDSKGLIQRCSFYPYRNAGKDSRKKITRA